MRVDAGRRPHQLPGGLSVTKLLSMLVTSVAAGVLLAVLGLMYLCVKLRTSPWLFPKGWLFFTISVVVVGTALELWLARRTRDKEILDVE